MCKSVGSHKFPSINIFTVFVSRPNANLRPPFKCSLFTTRNYPHNSNNAMPGLTGAQQQECKECFDLFDRDGSGKIEVNLLGKIVRSVGQTPSNVSFPLPELQKHNRKPDPNKPHPTTPTQIGRSNRHDKRN